MSTKQQGLIISAKVSKRRVISQKELADFYAIQTQFEDVSARYEAVEARIAEALEHGSTFQNGEHKPVRLKERSVRRPAWKQIFIDRNSETAARRILENTEPKIYHYLDWEGRRKHGQNVQSGRTRKRRS